MFVLLGVRFSSYHGNFMLRSTDLMALPAVDCDKAYAAQLSLEETLLTTPTVYFQVALLYPCVEITDIVPDVKYMKAWIESVICVMSLIVINYR